jgi:hypothetical protein
MEIKFTIVHTSPVKHPQEDGSFIDGEMVHLMHSPSHNPLRALDEIIEDIADMELDDDTDDDDREVELMRAVANIPGRFDVYEGKLDVIPKDLTPVRTETMGA